MLGRVRDQQGTGPSPPSNAPFRHQTPSTAKISTTDPSTESSELREDHVAASIMSHPKRAIPGLGGFRYESFEAMAENPASLQAVTELIKRFPWASYLAESALGSAPHD